MAWKDPETLKVVGQYARLALSVVLIVVLLVMFATDRIDLITVIRALLGLLAVERTLSVIAFWRRW